MAKNESNEGRWVDERLASLEPGAEWKPDPERGLSRLHDRRRAARRHTIEWVVAGMAGAAACVALVVTMSPGACARPLGCSAGGSHPAVQTSPGPAPVAPPPPQTPAPVPAAAVAFKQFGLPTAPVLCEIYTDYECPSCAALYRTVVPVLMERYVATGKVRLLHRDFPLPQHPYARLAARYANAAGETGHYEEVVNQIFRTQSTWASDGDLSSQVAQVVSPEAMDKIRELVARDSHLDDTVMADMSMAMRDQIRQTPTLVFVVDGKRQPLPGLPQLEMLETYLDQLVASAGRK